MRVGDLEVDAAARVVRLRGAPIALSQKEFGLVRALASEPTRVFTKEELLRTIWGFRTLGTTRTLDSHACRLRHKLGRFGDRFVVNVWGVGYRLVDGPPGERIAGLEAAPPLAPAAAMGAPLAAGGSPRAVAVALVVWLLAGGALGLAGRWRRRARRRSELVARACHELRGALTAARLAVYAATRGREASAPRLRAIERELARAGVALEDLAAARRGRRAAERDDAVDVAELLAGHASTWQVLAAVFGSRLEVGGSAADALVRGDGLRLGQAVSNLVANAVEHGSGRVEVLARALDGRVRIEVADEGPGLPAPVADLTRRARGGRGRRGRGLAIAADIADRHGGRLVAAPSARGARVALELPAWRGRH